MRPTLLNFIPSIAAVIVGPLVLGAPKSVTPTNAQSWTLPSHLTVIDSGPRTYHFSIDYNTANAVGQIVQRQRITGDYTRGLKNNEVEWHNVGIAATSDATDTFSKPENSAFMEGFRYRNDPGATMAPTFFQTFPAAAFMERNLVWDTAMFESFAQNYFEKLRLNLPLHTDAKDQDVQLAGVGTFRNHDIVLEWVGFSSRRGENCALIEYRAFFNPVNINAGVTMKARSDYWGELWVSVATKQIEYATLYEEVTGQLTVPGQNGPQPLNVFRVGTFEPVSVSSGMPQQ